MRNENMESSLICLQNADIKFRYNKNNLESFIQSLRARNTLDNLSHNVWRLK